MLKKRKNRRLLVIVTIVVLIGIQFIPVDFSIRKTDTALDFISINGIESNKANILRTACYDCHSRETKLPWYSGLAPVSWYLKFHVSEGREKVNFSNWGKYSEKKREALLTECYDVIDEDEMPLSSYVFLHPEAQLTDTQKEELLTIFEK